MSFIDVDGATTKVGSVTTNASGSFSVSVAVPRCAVPGKGKLKATGVGGLTAAGAFTVKAPA